PRGSLPTRALPGTNGKDRRGPRAFRTIQTGRGRSRPPRRFPEGSREQPAGPGAAARGRNDLPSQRPDCGGPSLATGCARDRCQRQGHTRRPGRLLHGTGGPEYVKLSPSTGTVSRSITPARCPRGKEIRVQLVQLLDDSPVPKPNLDPLVTREPLGELIPPPVRGTAPLSARRGWLADLGQGQILRHPQLDHVKGVLQQIPMHLPVHGPRTVRPSADTETQ